jgi:hypothetical protein
VLLNSGKAIDILAYVSTGAGDETLEDVAWFMDLFPQSLTLGETFEAFKLLQKMNNV